MIINHYVEQERLGGRGGDHKDRAYKSSTGPDPLESHSYQASIQSWAIISLPAKGHLNGVSMVGRWSQTFTGIWWIHSPRNNLNKTTTKNVRVEVDALFIIKNLVLRTFNKLELVFLK